MINADLYERARTTFRNAFGVAHQTAGYAPGRAEILGNHTDYNDGLVLSAAIDFGTFFLAGTGGNALCRTVAADMGEKDEFPIRNPSRSPTKQWANYIRGVAKGVCSGADAATGFNAVIVGNVPLGAGLSSSAALEMATGLALASLYGLQIDPLDMARIGQRAEHDFVGAKCGLLDQISSLFGRANSLVMTDFRSLEVGALPLGDDACFLMCNTAVTHSLVDSEYNDRRAQCERAAAYFARTLDHPVNALRDVSATELATHAAEMDPVTARRAAHVIGENERVRKGQACLERSDLPAFGELMFQSHNSSRINFENSCPELDFLVDEAKRVPGVLGARLSGGGFGGSVVMLLHPRDTEHVALALRSAYHKAFGHECDVRPIRPSPGACVIEG